MITRLGLYGGPRGLYGSFDKGGVVDLPTVEKVQFGKEFYPEQVRLNRLKAARIRQDEEELMIILKIVDYLL
jgi:hypothetical protein